eukprot:6384816-Prymnesium_polylepis.1
MSSPRAHSSSAPPTSERSDDSGGSRSHRPSASSRLLWRFAVRKPEVSCARMRKAARRSRSRRV